ncbi:flagellar filament capping protein FliD [Amnibacterium kyonggiense]|uniref:Flagellar hook-associated protein 2 n=1 Tax=Amnibacterium kyonggiense TaxID=595671 RepID=A0A4R7FQJ6_9MICO|nr:flagellar filament capping protein FliD [Amnibacterium kyonggiense]TDS80065.1 flagellar hook-associated protein 2 [Amnibacterium kyonggiense]
MATTAALSTTSTTGLGLSGLSSGLDTSGIITKLMSVESAPQTALKTQLSSTTTYRTALQSLNSSVAAIATSAKSAAAANALSSFTATSDTSGVTATASSTASAGSVSFTVDRLAQAQVSVTGTMTAWPAPADGTTTPSITLQVGSGTAKTVSAASTNLDDVVAAINGSGTGITATKVAVGSSNGVPQYRLQLRGATGDGNGFSVYQGDTTSAPALATTQTQAAQSAQITLYKGVAGAEQQVSSTSNTFDDLLTGVDVTVSAVSTSTATINVAADSTAATTAAQALTSSLITLFSGISAASAISTTTSSSGTTSATSGSVFTGDSIVRAVNDSLLSAVSDAVNGTSPSSIGINLTKDGTITFDSSKFAAAMASDPAGTTAMFQTIAGRVASAATGASDSYTGTLTQKITSQQSTESDLTKQISDWDTRLATIQAQYTSQFNALETALNSLSSQASYLTSQISGLTTNYQTSG